MANHDAKLGLGLATGMFYHAASGTSLPSYPLATLSGWTKVGDVSSDGISLSLGKSTSDFRTWANEIKRTALTEHNEDITVPIMDTTKEALKTVFGSAAVTTTAATSSHGNLVSVEMSEGELPDEEAYLFLMKDGDDTIMIGTTRGQIKAVADVAFQPGALITWTPTITGLGDGWKLITDDGDTTS